jgi:hypothetical protein
MEAELFTLDCDTEPPLVPCLSPCSSLAVLLFPPSDDFEDDCLAYSDLASSIRALILLLVSALICCPFPERIVPKSFWKMSSALTFEWLAVVLIPLSCN